MTCPKCGSPMRRKPQIPWWICTDRRCAWREPDHNLEEAHV